MKNHSSFWGAHPALLIGISFSIGIGTALFSFPIVLTLLFAAYLAILKKWPALSTLPLAIVYCFFLYTNVPTQNCTGRFSISSVQPHKTPFHTNLIYKGTFYLDHTALPCTISANSKMPANCDYLLSGTLIKRAPFDYTFKPKSWNPIPYTFSLAEYRYLAKDALRSFLHAHLHRPRTAELLTSLTSGEVDDRLLRFEFGRLGLQHILAISGFHFGILIAFLALSLKFLPHTFQWLSMILLTSAYYFFLGDSPAVERAYLTALLFLLAKLLRRPSAPINLLGTAFLIELIFNPLIITNLGFQFSFGSSFGILLLLDPLKKLLPIRPPLFTNALCLTLAVNIALLPLLLYHFGRFPLLGLLYNLFFPFLISLLLFSFLSVLLLSTLIPSLTHPLFSLLDLFASELLNLVSYPPLPLDHSIYIKNIPTAFIPVYLFGLLCLSIKIYDKNKSERETIFS